MQIDVEVNYSTNDYHWLCFRHAVQEAMRGGNVMVEVTDYIMLCSLCEAELEESAEKHEEWYKNYVNKLEESSSPPPKTFRERQREEAELYFAKHGKEIGLDDEND